jgi:ATP-dependent Clp protease ATP-binding subunit ClpC
MRTARFPILLWRDARGQSTAAVVFDASIAAVGETPAAAAGTVRDYLQWTYKQKPWTSPPDFHEPRLVQLRVDVRPEYQHEERIFPCPDTFALRVACVTGKDRNGLLLCAMPTLNLLFNYADERSFKGLVAHFVQGMARQMTPERLARQLLPPGLELDDVVIPIIERDYKEPPPDLEALNEVAQPVDGRANRARQARPWQRDETVAKLATILAKEKASVLLLGDGGVGKTTILTEAARKIGRLPLKDAGGTPLNEDQDKTMREIFGELVEERPKVNRFWTTTASRLIAGMQYLGQWQERVEQVVAELESIDGVLHVENLLDLVRNGGRDPISSIAAFLVPYLQRNELRLVAECTPAELDACRRLLPGFADVFQVLSVPPFQRNEAIAAMDQLANVHRQNLRIDYDRQMPDLVQRLFARFMPYAGFPGRASAFVADLFDHAARARLAAVTPQLVIDRFVRLTGLPERFLRDDLPLHHAEVVESLAKKVIGQRDACLTAANVITAFKAGLNDPARPIGVLLFCGPTGVGKTELARAIGDLLFSHGEAGGKDRMVRLDMSEYATPGAADRLLNDPGGGESELIKRLRQQPFTVVLLDEMEKAAPEVFDVLMGVFDEGRLTDRFGRVTTFRSALIIMTSNLGAGAPEPFGFNRPSDAPYEAEAYAFFRPEFFNRMDGVVTFHPLSPGVVKQIAEKELRSLSQREGLTRARLTLSWTDRVVDLLVAQGFDRRYGARPLQRTLEQLIVTPLARHLVENPELSDATLSVDVVDGRITFTRSRS